MDKLEAYQVFSMSKKQSKLDSRVNKFKVKCITTQIKTVQLGDTNVKQSGPNTKKKPKVAIFTNYTD
jgi:hypothetical protein